MNDGVLKISEFGVAKVYIENLENTIYGKSLIII